MDPSHFNFLSNKAFGKCYWQHTDPANYLQLLLRCNKSFLLAETTVPQLFKTLQDAFFIWNSSWAIFASNTIEEAGLAFKDTHTLTSAILKQDGDAGAVTLDTNQHEYIDKESLRDVIQHVQAYHYLCVKHKNENLTLKLIQHTHTLLMKDTIREDGFKIHPGQFRTHNIAIGRDGQLCCEPKQIQTYMESLIESYQQQMNCFESIESKKPLPIYDPISLSTWLKYMFVKIHPFEDGNGRMSRLLLNWALMKFGLPFPISLQLGFIRKAKKNYFACLNDSPDLPSPFELLHTLPRLLNALVLESICSHWCSFFEHSRFIDSRICIHALPQKDGFGPLGWKTCYGNPQQLRLQVDHDLSRFSTGSIDKNKINAQYNFNAQRLMMYSRKNEITTRCRIKMELLGLVLAGETLTDNMCSLVQRNQHTLSSMYVKSPIHFQSIVNLAVAYRFLCITQLKEKLSVNLIMETHTLLCPDSNHDRGNMSMNAYLFPPSTCVSSALHQLISSINELLEDPASDKILVAATLMYEIWALHSFANGNGRLSRLLCNWVLLNHGIPFPISFGFELGVPRGHAALKLCMHTTMHNAGHPGMLATRLLVSIHNGFNALFSKTPSPTSLE